MINPHEHNREDDGLKRETCRTIWQMGWKITLGCAIFALGFDLFLEPNSLNVGGMSGLALILRELLGFGSIGVRCV